jgi:hypothetical protein
MRPRMVAAGLCTAVLLFILTVADPSPVGIGELKGGLTVAIAGLLALEAQELHRMG